jgi:FKBP-type peptidyl-prolyl cis-trans isomerase
VASSCYNHNQIISETVLATKVLIVIASLALIGLVVGAVLVLKGGTSSSGTAASPTPTPAATPASNSSAKLESTDEVVGTGAEAKEGSSITVKYTGTLADGTVFDSTEKQGGQPATFTLAKGQLIDGWVQGIPGMKVGGKRKLVIPPELAYGSQSQGGIPPNSTLTFEIELVDVK